MTEKLLPLPKAFKSTCVPRRRASVAPPLRSGAAAKSSPIPSRAPRFELNQPAVHPRSEWRGICSGCSPRPNGDSGATSLVTCRRCRLPTLPLVRDRLSEFSQPLPSRTIPRFNNLVATGASPAPEVCNDTPTLISSITIRVRSAIGPLLRRLAHNIAERRIPTSPMASTPPSAGAIHAAEAVEKIAP